MRALILIAGAALTVSACGGGNKTEANEVDTLAVDNLVVDNGLDANAAMVAANGAMVDHNAMDSDTHNMMIEKDRNTNDPDTNLANGM